MLLLFLCGITSVMAENNKSVKDMKEVVIGLDDTFAPMGFTDKNGEIIGFDIDLAKEVFKKVIKHFF